MKKFGLTFILLATLANLNVYAATLYVKTTGNDSNDGRRLTRAKRTIQAAINAAKSGDTVAVAAGTYKEKLHLKEGITVSGAGAERTRIEYGGDHVVVHASKIQSGQVSGFTIAYTGTGKNATVLLVDSSVTVTQNVVTGATFSGIDVEGKSNPQITANTIQGNTQNGIFIHSGAGGTISGNTIAGNGSHGITVREKSDPQIIHNTIVNNKKDGIWVYGGAAPRIQNNIIVKNKVHGIDTKKTNGPDGQPIVSYNDVWGNSGGNYEGLTKPSTDISADPLFVDFANGDYHLQPNSPARGKASDGSDLGAYPSSRSVVKPRKQDLPQQTTRRPRFFADLAVSNPRFVEPSGNRALDAEERGHIAFTLENRGRGAAEEVGVTLVPLADTPHLTYTQTKQVGSISAGASKSVEIPVTAGFDMANGTVTFRVVVEEKWGYEPDPFTVTFDTQAFRPPKLVIDDNNIGVDDDKAGDSYGDNDSRIELKEIVEVTVAVQNLGAGDAEAVKAEVLIDGEGQNIYYTSPSAIFEFGDIPAGDFKQFTFAFSTNNRYKPKELPITIKVTERTGKFGLTKSLGLKVDTPIKSSRDVVVVKIRQPQQSTISKVPQFVSMADRVPKNALPQFPDAVAVIFGIEEYRSAPPARFANRDATIFFEYAKAVLGIPEANIKLATNELATKGEFDKVFAGERNWIAKRITPGETEVFVFYSGHGISVSGKSTYLIPQDADPNYAKTTGVPLAQLYERLDKLGAKHVTVFIDACFSGGSRRIERGPETMLVANARPIFATIEGPLGYGNLTVITASEGAQISSGYPDEKHGLFTFYLLMGLGGEADINGDKAVTVGELGDYLKTQIPTQALALFDREQTPTVQTNEPERVLVRFR